MADVLLVTCRDLPVGEPGAPALDAALAELGITSRWVAWDDESVDWASAKVVAVRSTWDYVHRLDAFLDWARRVDGSTRLLNGADVFRWNTDKQYLVELGAAGVPVVPTVAVEVHDDLVAAAASLDGRVVVKPRVGAGGLGVMVVDDPDDLADAEVGPGPWAVQPVIESVSAEGELSVFVIGGEPICAVRKLPVNGSILVNEEFGGTLSPAPLDDEAVALAQACVRAAEGLLDTSLDYARVDQMRLPSGDLAVSELEATEPGLYLDIMRENAEPFARLIRSRH